MNYTEAKEQFERLFSNRMDEKEARDFLIELYDRGETIDEITAAVEVMKSHAIRLEVDPAIKPKLIDIVGTGGDQSGSFNISSTTALLVTSLGCFVAKHGSRSITSKSGSADVLEQLGIRLDHTLAQEKAMLEACGFTFLFAQAHHPAMKHIVPIRRSIPHRTIFNILGPLTNPADVKKQFVGAYDPAFVEKMAQVLQNSGSERAMVAASLDGLDELSLGAPSFVAELKDGTVTTYELDPQTLGFKKAGLEMIKGGESEANARITRGILEGTLEGAKRDIVLLNASAALIIEGMARDWQDGIQMAAEAIDSGKAKAALEKIIRVSQSL
jgi:anthranilate phosphoribosyltransferase